MARLARCRQGHDAARLAIELPKSPSSVMSASVGKEIYERLIELTSRTHDAITVTPPLAERMAHRLSEKLGNEYVARPTGASPRTPP